MLGSACCLLHPIAFAPDQERFDCYDFRLEVENALEKERVLERGKGTLRRLSHRQWLQFFRWSNSLNILAADFHEGDRSRRKN